MVSMLTTAAISKWHNHMLRTLSLQKPNAITSPQIKKPTIYTCNGVKLLLHLIYDI